MNEQPRPITSLNVENRGLFAGLDDFFLLFISNESYDLLMMTFFERIPCFSLFHFERFLDANYFVCWIVLVFINASGDEPSCILYWHVASVVRGLEQALCVSFFFLCKTGWAVSVLEIHS